MLVPDNDPESIIGVLRGPARQVQHTIENKVKASGLVVTVTRDRGRDKKA